ncbi:Patellin-3 [Acorus gramineus]|uniref:Patellin-3 n=1 Tax=Acorus gramineus TaxID=55184 RepID=A0AAV9BF41_ACOGR|nr:Patellin-3 [Acorus gramineus]
MAEEPQATTEAPAAPAAAEESKVAAAAEEVAVSEKEAPAAEEAKKEETVEETAAIASLDSFKEESNRVADLKDPEKKALEELKQLVQEALNKHEFTAPPPPPPAAEPAPAEAPAESIEVTKEEEKTEAAPAESSEVATEAPAAAEVKPAEVVEEPPKPEAEVSAATEEPPKAVVEEAPVKPAEETPAVAVVEEKAVETIEESAVSVKEPGPASEEKPAEDPAPAAVEAEAEVPPPPPEEVSIWGVTLLGDERSDVILLKFLRARDFKVKDALAMLKSAVRWRREFGIEDLLGDADLEAAAADFEKAVFMHGVDKEEHPVCYNAFGVFQDKELYAKVFADEEKRQRFLRWRIRFLEKGIRELLDFNPGAVCTMVQVNDLKNSPGFFKREFMQATDKAITILSDNYPEFIARQVVINVPWWYLAFNRMISPFLTQRSKSKFVYAGPSKSAETIFKYIAPDQVPVQYGGLGKDSDADFSTADAVTDVTIKPGAKHTVEIPVSETGVLIWELRVLGWGVNYSAEFVPNAEGEYSVIVSKARKLLATDEPILKNSFKVGEPGKIVLTIDNVSSKKKKLLFRSKTKSTTE